MDKEKSYEDGLLEGKIQAMEAMISSHGVRIVAVEQSTKNLERVAWILTGGILLAQIAPSLKAILS